jgi:diguanylate cyclase (GGDEF)-like protein
MSSDRRHQEPIALLVGPPGESSRLVPDHEHAAIRVLDTRTAAQLRPFPARPLVLLADPDPSPSDRERLAAAARRGRNPGWYLIAEPGAGEELAAAWEGVPAELLTAPVSPSGLSLLAVARRDTADARRELVRSRRSARSLDRRLTVLSETLRAAGSLLDPRMVSRFIMQRAAALVNSEWWRLYRLDENRGSFRLDAHVEPDGVGAPAEWLPLDRGLAGITARSRAMVHVKDPLRDARVDRIMEWPQQLPESILAAPMVSRGRVIGVTELADPKSGRFTTTDIDLVRTLMEPASIALDNAELFRKLEERTVTDDLTQLYNARFMENYLRREAKRAVRYGHPVALLFIDLDGFKQVNDVHGHMAGSRTLVEVGEVLRANVREIDVVARWGGDEFAVVLPDTGAEGAFSMADRIREKIAERTYLAGMGLEVRVSASIGVAAFPEHGASAEQLLAGADAAMYRVKDAGKNGVAFAESTEEPAPAPVPAGV